MRINNRVCRTSFQNIVLIKPTRKTAPKVSQSIKVNSGWVLRGNARKCMLCGGVPNLVNGKVTRFYPVKTIYPHQKGCEKAK